MKDSANSEVKSGINYCLPHQHITKKDYDTQGLDAMYSRIPHFKKWILRKRDVENFLKV